MKQTMREFPTKYGVTDVTILPFQFTLEEKSHFYCLFTLLIEKIRLTTWDGAKTLVNNEEKYLWTGSRDSWTINSIS